MAVGSLFVLLVVDWYWLDFGFGWFVLLCYCDVVVDGICFGVGMVVLVFWWSVCDWFVFFDLVCLCCCGLLCLC